MKKEDQFCTVSQADRLRELAISQDSLFAFVKGTRWIKDHDWELVIKVGYEWEQHPGYKDYPCHLAAFSLAELSVMLPQEMLPYHVKCIGARAWADVLIYALEKELLTAEVVNDRMTQTA
jgi:hypothetical protein